MELQYEKASAECFVGFYLSVVNGWVVVYMDNNKIYESSCVVS